jgi:hypothetical protein
MTLKTWAWLWLLTTVCGVLAGEAYFQRKISTSHHEFIMEQYERERKRQQADFDRDVKIMVTEANVGRLERQQRVHTTLDRMKEDRLMRHGVIPEGTPIPAQELPTTPKDE